MCFRSRVWRYARLRQCRYEVFSVEIGETLRCFTGVCEEPAARGGLSRRALNDWRKIALHSKPCGEQSEACQKVHFCNGLPSCACLSLGRPWLTVCRF